jgi:alpha-L-rhamnosidase
MLGQIIEWFYRDLAGICPDPMDPGFKKIIIKPQPVSDLSYVKASFNSIHGEIVSDWEHTNDSFILRVTIPANTTATVYIPAGPDAKITESGIPAGKSPGVKFLRHENAYAVYEIGSGKYEFQSRL